MIVSDRTEIYSPDFFRIRGINFFIDPIREKTVVREFLRFFSNQGNNQGKCILFNCEIDKNTDVLFG